ncbi:MAG TPA: DUF2855 family protein [Acidimicrobiales bacterium]|nr:DUF2855 family protein [Acidimicrobiales bacterium]
MASDLVVKRDALHEVRLDEFERLPLEEGEARLRVDRFAFTANNVTYAVFGAAMRYWDFFPASEPSLGRIPVWGFADVVESHAQGVEEGVRVYGYLPMSTDFVVRPGRVNERGFTDTFEHRQPMAAAYNAYLDVGTDPVFDADHEPAMMLLRPLYYTAFLLDDFLADNGYFGATSVVLSSASSKTALGTAYFLSQREDIEIVGLTSPGNAAFVEGLGVYSSVVTYDAADDLPLQPCVFVDIAGDAAVRTAVHRRFGGQLVHSSAVGGTHWQAAPPTTDGTLPGAAPSFFFAPDQARKRAGDWGSAQLDAAFVKLWHRAVGWSEGWLDVREARGADAVRSAYLEVLEGHSSPSVGHVLSLHD